MRVKEETIRGLPSENGVGALFSDLYKLTMLQAYEAEGMRGRAVFELVFRLLRRK